MPPKRAAGRHKVDLEWLWDHIWAEVEKDDPQDHDQVSNAKKGPSLTVVPQTKAAVATKVVATKVVDQCPDSSHQHQCRKKVTASSAPLKSSGLAGRARRQQVEQESKHKQKQEHPQQQQQQ
eukprot:CAMPEP_0206474394 /NCGR_PEP_ID=MMETSP0324_2-20121206/33460_1 /ASSEMBLY_ACC=CAM_ASM_000836 /TAXON_ID=2866 /ORGANISM="Crypthecodinium cohnii, Strain Seligo" /LENGTH=121 /DNA_ID=CAMNT_0053949557 /DNA_START=121 /DNA_END=483 /DNA_ORIENTATION=+